LYRKVTIRIQQGVLNGDFENGERMEKLDVIFENRYLEAYHRYRNHQSPSKSSKIVFDKANNYWIIVLEHILFGVNANINLYLEIAAAKQLKKTLYLN